MRKAMGSAVLMFVLACGGGEGDQQVATRVSELGGAVVLEVTSTRFNMLTGDPDAGVWLTVGGTAQQMRALCAGTNPGPLSPAQVHAVYPPSSAHPISLNIRVDAGQTVLWRMTADFGWSEDFDRAFAFFCADANAEPIATGTSDGFLRDSVGETRESWAWLGRGVLTTSDGSALFFNHSGACRLPDPRDPDQVRCDTRMELH